MQEIRPDHASEFRAESAIMTASELIKLKRSSLLN